MSRHQRTYDDALSRALHAAADQIEPSGDGLERIRARLSPPMPAPAAWMTTGYQRAAGQLLGRVTSLGAWLESLAGQIAERYRLDSSDQDGGSHALRWLRPAGAAATAAVIVVMGVFAIRTLPQAISPAAVNQPAGQGQQGGQGNGPGPAGRGSLYSSSILPGAPGGVPVPLGGQSTCKPQSATAPYSPPQPLGSPSASEPASTPTPSTSTTPPATTSPSQSPSSTPSQSPGVTQATPSTEPGATAAGTLAQDAAAAGQATAGQRAGSQPGGRAGTQVGATATPKHSASPTPTPTCGG